MPSAPGLTEADRLDRLVTLLDAACSSGGWFQPHRLVMVESDPADPTALLLGQRVLAAGDHPLDHLLGFTAPPDWLGLGVICFGWTAAAPTGDNHDSFCDPPSPHPAPSVVGGGCGRRRVRVVTLLERTGNQASTAALDDGAVSDEPAEGTVSDALHRCLGLPTPAPPASTAEFFAVLWLQGLLSAPRGIAWADAAAQHPAFAWLGALGRRPGCDDLITAGRAIAETLDWPTLRASVAAQAEVTLVAPHLAAWMDDGMFARWVLGRHPALPALLDALEVTLAPAFLGRVRRTLAEWDLPGAG